MAIEIEKYILIFFIYSFAGWTVETIGDFIKNKKFINRGFLIGPYCPIYGAGVIAITIFLQKYKNDIVALFFLSIILCGILEYVTSYIMEKIFKARWWDYSNQKFNINGRICLETLVLFGIGGVIIINVMNPLLFKFFEMIPAIPIHIITAILTISFIIDIIISLKIVFNLKEMSRELKDNTIEISEKVRKIILKKLRLYRRLVRAFPRIKDKVLYNNWEEIKKKIESSREEIASKIDNSKEDIKNKIDLSKAELKGIINVSKKHFKKLYRKKEKK